MEDWNVVVTIREHRFAEAMRLLADFGPVSRTDYYNVAVLRVDDIPGLLEELRARIEAVPTILSVLARLVPASERFAFRSAAEFEEKAESAVQQWRHTLAGSSFHVRMHRRGFRGRLASTSEEQVLDALLLQQLGETGQPGRIDFDDPDFIVSVETVGQQAGLACWSREERRRYPFLGLD